VAILIGAKNLFTLEGSDVDSETHRGYLLVELLPMPDRGLTLLCSHVVFFRVARVCELPHVFNQDVHSLRIYYKLALCLFF